MEKKAQNRMHGITGKNTVLLIIVLLFVTPGPMFAQQGPDSTLLDVNYRDLVSRADLAYDQPAKRSEAGMPVGNGRTGSLVWTTPDMLKFQINRVDIFANSSASNNFYERNTSYNGGAGFVDIDFSSFSDGPFTATHFKQHLSVYDGEVRIAGKGVEATVTAWDEHDIMAVQIEDKRKKPAVIKINLRMLRSPVVGRGNHTALSNIETVDNKIILTQKFTEDKFYSGSAIVIGVSGREAKTRVTNESEVQLAIAPGNGPFSIFIGSAASFAPDEDVVELATRQVNAALSNGFTEVRRSTRAWWHDFWEKGFIYLHSEDGKADIIEKNYTYYLYVMASSSRGKYPPKFNGMLWTTGGDARQWGSAYWGANQSCLYNALFPTNRIELMDPMFNRYTKARRSFETAARQQWGSKGMFIPETMTFDGLPELPGALVKEIQDLYLLRKPWEKRSDAFNSYASTKMPFLSRWNWKTDVGWENGKWQYTNKGAGPFGHVTHIFSRGAKIAYQYWLKYEYLQDEEWLRTQAYPVIKGIAEFYRNFPNVRKGIDGDYHIYHVNDNESIWGGHNTVEEISSMRGILPVAIKASEILDVDKNQREKWREFLNHLSPLPVSTNNPDADEKKEKVWIRALPPIVEGNGNRVPDPNTMPVWFFDLATLESDSEVLKIASATYNEYFEKDINENTDVNVLSKLPVTGTLLGRREAARFLILNQIQTSEVEVMPNRMDLREGYQTTGVQRLGRAADALHGALIQSVPAGPAEKPVVRLFPAWPREWDAQFRLLVRGNFLVTASIRNGKAEFVKVLSRAGADFQLRNPWPGTDVTIYKNGRRWQNGQSDLFAFSTEKKDSYLFVKKGISPEELKQTLNKK